MTTDKARKRAVRARMDKTGERYAAARRQLVGKDRRLDPAGLPPRVAEPGMADDTVTRGTGRAWDDWLRLLDAWGAASRSHTEIARHVREEHTIDGWWAQTVAVGYERARGLRAVHQTARGFEVSVSKTVAASAAAVWPVIVEPRQRDRWLEPGLLRARPNARTEGRSVRFDLPADGTRVGIFITTRGARATVTVVHERLADGADVAARRVAWKGRLERLAGLWQDDGRSNDASSGVLTTAADAAGVTTR